jgi:CHAT domain-containing protein/tetratricopeptide (TPR) repeat protein
MTRAAGARQGVHGRLSLPARNAVVASLMLVLAGACGRKHPPAQVYRELHAHTDSLLLAGRLGDAVLDLRAVAAGGVEPAAAPWERNWAAVRAAHLARLLALPEPARRELLASMWPVGASVPEDADEWASLKPALEHQLAVRRRWLGEGAVDVAESMTALARVERRKGDSWRALRLDQAALRIRRVTYGPESAEVAESYMMLGRDHKLAEIPSEEPEAYQDSSLAIRLSLFGEPSSEYGDGLFDRANLDRWKARVPAAMKKFERVLTIRMREAGPRSAGVAEVLADMAVTRSRDSRWRDVNRLAAHAVAILDGLGSRPTAAYALSLNLNGLALRHLGRLKEAGRELERACAVQEARRRAAPRDDAVRSVFHPLAAYGDLATVRLMSGDSLGAWATLERGSSRRWLERAWENGQVDSARTWDRLLERVRSRLTDSTAVMGWLDPVNRPGSPGNPFWIYVIRRTGVRWVETQTVAEVAGDYAYAASDRLGRLLRHAAGWPFQIEQFDDVKLAQHSCWALRFSAAEPLLEGVRQLVIVSANINGAVPAEIMVDTTGRTLNERFVISYALSAVQYVNARDPERARRVDRLWRGVLLRAPGRPRGDAQTDDLRWADREVARLASRLRNSRVLAGVNASEAGLRQLASAGELPSADLLHFASHAQTDPSWPRRVWLALAESSRDGTSAPELPFERDGALSTRDISGWRLRAHLVTLASCQSAGATPVRTHAVTGLGQAFLEAGAQSVIISLWPVEDRATERFMEFFYATLFERRAQPRSIAEALREARIRLRDYVDRDGRRPFAHPMFWGGFVLQGDAG